MQLNEIRKELEGIIFDMVRVDTDDYFEAVIVKSELAKLTLRFNGLFGEPVSPSQEAQEMLKDFGGVWSGQTLYLRKDAKSNVFAMLWPWQDRKHITLKIGRK